MRTIKKLLSVLLSAVLLFGVCSAAFPAFAEEDKIIKEVRLTVTEPKVGEAADKNIVSSEPEKYTATARYWIKRLYGNENVVNFESGFEYALVFDVTPASGFKFEPVQKNSYNFDESPTAVYINGVKAECVSAETDAKLGRSYVVTSAEQEDLNGETNFFAKIIKSIKDFFAGIINFFKNLLSF